MATRIEKVLVCDICFKEDHVERWRLGKAKDKSIVSVDLCSVHAAPLEEARSKAPRGKRGQTKTRPVYTEAQVKAKARAQRAKKTPKTP